MAGDREKPVEIFRAKKIAVDTISDTEESGAAITISNQFTIADSKHVTLGTSTGTKLGTATGQKLGLWNVTPVIQPAGAAQADQGAMTASSPGTGADGTTWTGAQCTAAYNDIIALDTIVTAIRSALVAAGIMKGGA